MQGQSFTCTPVKHADYRAFLTMHLRIVAGILGRSEREGNHLYPAYTHFDLNAGCGVNEQAGSDPIPGSPLDFAQIAQGMGIRAEGYFFESDPKAAAALDQRLAEYRSPLLRLDVVRGDHLEPAFPLLSEIAYGKLRYGLVYSDPNGADTPFGLLAAFAEKLPCVDILCSINATARKRARMSPVHDSEKFPPLAECMAQIPKRHCLIRHPHSRHQWILALFSNWRRFVDAPAAGFADARSETGRAWLDLATYCESECKERGITTTRRRDRAFQHSLYL